MTRGRKYQSQEPFEFWDASGPQGDLFFTLAAVTLAIIIMLIPVAQSASSSAETKMFDAVEMVRESDVRVDGARVDTFVARSDGIIAQSGSVVHLDAILSDRGLFEALANSGKEGRPVLLLIEPGGEEAAFLFERPAASFGLRRFLQVRLTANCGGLQGRMKAVCIP